ncbi:MAG: GDSL-type esterase/lipase family protein [Nitrospirae bacterium]|nr:GDSL-type esterase/lipase family protein [Nitrospirota bacterium]MDA1304030.1 GDSL-type esterase/lipase family protein [Nitrospirota bacterium]
MSVNQPGDHRICFVGDSLVQGTGDPDALGWAGRVTLKARQAGWNVTNYNLGIRGDTSRDILVRWAQECARRFPPDTHHYIVFSFGVNDTMMEEGTRRISLDESRENFQKVLEPSRAKYSTLMIGPPPVNDADHNSRIQELSQSFNELASKIDVPFLSVFEPLRQDAIWIQEVGEDDGAHPGAGGYSRLARLVAQWSFWWFYREDQL